LFSFTEFKSGVFGCSVLGVKYIINKYQKKRRNSISSGICMPNPKLFSEPRDHIDKSIVIGRRDQKSRRNEICFQNPYRVVKSVGTLEYETFILPCFVCARQRQKNIRFQFNLTTHTHTYTHTHAHTCTRTLMIIYYIFTVVYTHSHSRALL